MAKKPESRPAFRTTIGGQALIEGILMLGPDKKGIVVRKSDGELEIKEEPRKLIKDRYPILGWPLIRGVVNFGSSMANGVRALLWSAEFYPEDGEEPREKTGERAEKEAGEENKGKPEEASEPERQPERKPGGDAVTSLVVGAAVLVGVLFSVGLFFLLPTFIAGFFDRFFDFALLHNIIEGVIRIVIFTLYLFLCSRMKDMRRMFSYHGAEHKTIFCYEAGLPLTVENVRIQPRHHPRCGTSFLFVVIVVSILISSVVFTYVEWTNLWVRMGLHLLLLPVVVAISYEFNRLVGRHDNWLTRVLSAPGLWMQNFTTFEPDDSMIEVGIASVKLVIPEEKGKDTW